MTPAPRGADPTRRPFRRILAAALVLLTAACAPLTVQEEQQLGREVQRQVRQQSQFVRDPVTVNYVRDLGEKLVEASAPSPFEFRFYVIEDEQLNAFAVPGGAIYVHTGLIMAVQDASELAGVMAHEIGHVTARHVAQMARRGRNTGLISQIGTILIAILTGSQLGAQAGSVVTGMAAQAYMSTYTQDAEREADRLGIDTMIRAGFDPNGMISMFETLKRDSAGRVRGPQFLSSHPATDERISNARMLIARREPLSGLRRDDGGRLKIIQQRLELIIGTDVEDLLEEDEE